MNTEPQIIHSLTSAAYHAEASLSSSRLKQFIRSPLHYHKAGQADTTAMLFGRMVHGLTLEPEAFFSEAIVVDVSTRNTKAYREAKKATNADVYLQHEIDLGTEIACAVHGDKYAAELIEDAVFETSFFWHEQGVNCKARTDIWQPRNNIVADLKTTTDASPKAFARDVLKYGMHISAAWYRRGLESAGHKLDKWFWIAVEKMPPYAVQVYRADDFWLDLADARIDAALPYLRECRRTDTWPSYADGVFNLAVPPWAYD